MWTENGCATIIDITEEGEIATCKCNHLTNFAVLAVTVINQLVLFPHIHVCVKCFTECVFKYRSM